MSKIKILDGGMGTELIKHGEKLPNHIWSASTNLTNPKLVYRIHKNYIKAGSEYIITNTFRTTPRAFRKTGLSIEKASNQAKKSFDLAIQSAKKASNKKIPILGSIAPLEDCYTPEIFPGQDKAIKEFYELAEWFSNKKIDFFLLETMNSIIETEICLKAIKTFNIPIWVSFNLLNSNQIRSGEKLLDAINMIKKFPVNCLLLNCNPLDRTFNSLKIIKKNWPLEWGLYPNLGIGEPSLDGIINNYCTNKDFLNLITESINLGANILGGCCGASPEHINLIKKTVKGV